MSISPFVVSLVLVRENVNLKVDQLYEQGLMRCRN